MERTGVLFPRCGESRYSVGKQKSERQSRRHPPCIVPRNVSEKIKDVGGGKK